jgi:WD40 repeat protein
VFAGSGGGGVITSYDAATGKQVEPALDSATTVRAPALSPDGRTLAYVKDFHIQLRDLSAGRDLFSLPPAGQSLWAWGAFQFSPDGRRLAADSPDGNVCLWDLQGRKLLQRLYYAAGNGAQETLAAMAFSSDGKLLATMRHNGVIQLWDPKHGQKLHRLELKEGRKTNFHAGAVEFSPDGTLLATSTSTFDGTGQTRVRIWDTATWKALSDLSAGMNVPDGGTPKQVASRIFSGSWEQHVIPRLTFSADGRMLAMNRWQKSIPVWEVASGRQRLLLQGHEESTAWVAFTRDGRTLASASWDKTIRLWDLETGEELRCLRGHRGKANSLAFTNDGRTLISAGDDSTLLFWDVAAQTQRPALAGEAVSAKELEGLWKELAAPDAGKAYRAMNLLRSSPTESIALLRRRLEAAPATDQQGAQISVRGREPWRSPDVLRQVRAVEVLEKIGTQPARRLLQKLAAGSQEARLTREAAAAAKRLVSE